MVDTETSAVPRIVRWLLPSLTQWLWLSLLLIMLSQPWRTAMIASDGDPCMHWRVGEWMLEHRQIIRADVFSYTRFGQPIISKEWLSELLFALAGRAAGLYGLCVLTAVVIATTFALLHRRLLAEGNDMLAATAVVLLAAAVSCVHWLARPHVFSFLLVLLWNDALRRYERTRRAWPLAAALGVCTLLWVNLHGAFLAGFLVLGAYWIGAVFERDAAKLKTLTLVGLWCAAVSLLNPSGYELHVHNLAFLHSKYFTNYLAEYSSPNFHSLDYAPLLAWFALLFFCFAGKRPRLSPAEIVLVMMWTYFALYAGRNIPLFVLVTAPLVAPVLSDCVRGKWRAFSERVRQASDAGGGWAVILALALAVVALAPGPTQMPAKNWPVAAVGFIQAHPDEFKGRMFNQYMWGGYLMEAMPEHKVFVDGRADFYGETLVKEFEAATALTTNWAEPLARYDVGWTLMPTDHRLNLALALLPGWQRVYSDEVAEVYCKLP